MATHKLSAGGREPLSALEEIINMAEHDALLAQSPAIYRRVAGLVAYGWTPQRIARFYAGFPSCYPALAMRIEGAAAWMRRSKIMSVNIIQ